MRSNVLLIGVDRLKNNSYVDLNVDDRQIRIAVKFVQDVIVSKSLGNKLYNVVAEAIRDDAVRGEVKVLLEDYIHPIFYYGVPAELSIPLSFKNRNIGTYQADDDKVKSTGLDDIKYLNQYYNNKRDFYISKLNDYLRTSKCFKGYINSCVGNDNKGYAVPININI